MKALSLVHLYVGLDLKRAVRVQCNTKISGFMLISTDCLVFINVVLTYHTLWGDKVCMLTIIPTQTPEEDRVASTIARVAAHLTCGLICYFASIERE